MASLNQSSRLLSLTVRNLETGGLLMRILLAILLPFVLFLPLAAQ